ncbi:flagellar protein FlbD [Caminicella sporogenes DSM 14501]|uniref:Flagellar protein FlbD n=1 Tax=Caminicella sporogenes DSM 14501 TaxID=1121266 RepID=A0A1M6LC42_9FIRM|nr:flagellar FlbD family protein [Caminicella sporogenes]RKD27781.1 flagellar protein FlbD [Caminicella sporogenes]WIF94642.1 flagellar FlbD family protein [Caminicella sporogenes]SHJ68732.1 flagellar protein FlbD [Caminicella sporogenes DSM 14501]
MIYVTRLNHDVFALNCDLIETIEETPDTVITLTTGKKIVVAENIDEIIDKIIQYKRNIYNNFTDSSK